MLDKLEKFDVVRDGDLVLKFDPSETTVLREYAVPLAHEALKKLSATYQFTPKGPILIEISRSTTSRFATSVCLDLSALGACFGRVVSMDSPRAKPPGTFSWQATLWHELAHVVTLQMSNPRAALADRRRLSLRRGPREALVAQRDGSSFALALERDQVLKLRDLNSGLPSRTPSRSRPPGVAARRTHRRHARPGAQHAGPRLRGGRRGDAAISKGLGISLDELQATFDKMLDARQRRPAALRDIAKPAKPGGPADERQTGDLAALKTAAGERPGGYRAQLALGAALAKQGDKAAFEPLEKAAALVPMATGADSPHAIMGRLAEQVGDKARAIKE